MNIYLAGKVGGPKWEFARRLKTCHSFVASDGNDKDNHGCDRLDHGFTLGTWPASCRDLSFQDQHGSYLRFDSAKTTASARFTEAIEQCDMLVAYIDTPDSFGSIAEIAYASAKKIPCHVFAVDSERMPWDDESDWVPSANDSKTGTFFDDDFYEPPPCTPIDDPRKITDEIHLPSYSELSQPSDKPADIDEVELKFMAELSEWNAELAALEIAEQDVSKSPMFDAYWFVLSLPNVQAHICLNMDDAAKEFSYVIGRVGSLVNKCESPIEKTFYAAASRHLEITPQYKIGKYRLDFAVPDLKVCIELDGHNFHKTKEQRTHDASRQRWLQANGWQVIRFTGSEVHRDVDRCVRETLKIINVARRNHHAMV